MGLEALSREKLQDISMIDLAYEVLASEKQPLTFMDVVEKVKEMKDVPEGEYEEQIARLYTNMNLDGRFVGIGEKHWGLRGWYPFDQKEEDIEVPAPKPKKKRREDDEDLEDVYEDEDEYEDEDYTEDEEEDYDVDDEYNE
ncbi:MAG TPA: DNA-directed RNA polymerase subunit delta [Bacillales bacterium]|nr:DNA-directed RNA polymerase subunit delta [Bacillales bacterium]